jgi:hypothetical protein
VESETANPEIELGMFERKILCVADAER